MWVNQIDDHLHALSLSLFLARKNYWKAFWHLDWTKWRFHAEMIKKHKEDILAYRKQTGLW